MGQNAFLFSLSLDDEQTHKRKYKQINKIEENKNDHHTHTLTHRKREREKESNRKDIYI